jgi:hypothetical protein
VRCVKFSARPLQVFDRPHHQRIARVLESLDGSLLREHACWFGRGTAISLRLGEFRESVDIDFLVSDSAGYRELRQRLRSATSLAALTRRGVSPLPLSREFRMDQYGMRGFVDIGLQPIKFEIVNEGRIEFSRPTAADEVCGVATLCLPMLIAGATTVFFPGTPLIWLSWTCLRAS